MNKMYGIKSDFAPVREEGSRIVVSYDLTQLEDKKHYEWLEVYLYKRQNSSMLTLEAVKKAILSDIDADTDANILSGYQWTVLHGDDEGKVASVWLSKENQMNYKAKHDAARDYPDLVTFPMKYKIAETEESVDVYEEFQDINELAQFFIGAISHIESCVNAGWARKKSIDWTPYEKLFPASDTSNSQSE